MKIPTLAILYSFKGKMQQLFIVNELHKKGNLLFLPNVPNLLSQLRKVLRTKIGDTIFLQPAKPDANGNITRYQLKITNRTDKDLEGEIIGEQSYPLLGGSPDQHQVASGGRGGYGGTGGSTTLLIAMPNKREKAELIVQKLSEIGVEEILFRPAENSVIKQWNEKKAERLNKIAKEAVEQSRGMHIPNITRCENIQKVCAKKEVIVFDVIPLMKGDIGGSKSLPLSGETSQDCKGKGWQRTSPTPPSKGGKLGIIWPEGWLTKKDYEQFGKEISIINLWKTVLRMETASIIAWWLLRNRGRPLF